MITIVGLGPGTLHSLPAEAVRVLQSGARVLVRTARHPAAQELAAQGHALEPLDAVYEAAPSFGELYPRLSEQVLAAAREGDVVYAVPGHPLMGEESVRLVLRAARAAGIAVRVLPAMSFADAVAGALAQHGEAVEFTQLQVVDGAALERVWWDVTVPALVFQVDDDEVASRVKIALMEEYGDEHPVQIVRWAGVPEAETVTRVPLFELDRPAAGAYDHLTTLYLAPLSPDARRTTFQDFVELIATLRSPQGCPWDREQTYETLKRFVLEEAYEVLEAVDSGDPTKLCDELGDLMIQVLMYAQFACEDGYFDIRDVIGNVVAKLIRRHPHVFGDVSAADTDEVLRNWEQIKATEKPERTSRLDGVPVHLPALMKAMEVSKRVVKVGFEWVSLEAVFAKLDEEVGELKQALPTRDPVELRDEIGDILFTVVNVARWLKVDPEEALRVMVGRFGDRFRIVERRAAERGRNLQEMKLAELDALWDEAKAELARQS